jgi:hypothetical protein
MIQRPVRAGDSAAHCETGALAWLEEAEKGGNCDGGVLGCSRDLLDGCENRRITNQRASVLQKILLLVRGRSFETAGKVLRTRGSLKAVERGEGLLKGGRGERV